jgi:hypothetical protein
MYQARTGNLSLWHLYFILICLCPVVSFAGTVNYVYDTLGRLEQAQYPNGTIMIIKNSYDNVGNRISQEIASSTPLTVALSAEPASPKFAGTAVMFTASATGGASPYQYRFQIYDSGGTVISKQDYGGAATYAWSTVGLAGTYTAEASARSYESKLDNEAVQSMSYVVLPTVDNVAVSATPAAPSIPGTSVTVKGIASGGVAPYQYQFLVKDSNGAIQASTAYGSSDSFIWNTTGYAFLAYTLQVNACSAGSTACPEKSATMTYQIVTPVASATISASPAGPQYPGTTVTLTATASGGSGAPEYQFWRQGPSDNSFVVVQGYVSSATCAWNTTSLPPGIYNWKVYARNAGSTAAYEATSPVLVYTLAIPPVTGVSLSSSVVSPQAPGTTVSFTASATGGYAPLQYRFQIRNSGGTVLSTQTYGASNVYSWNTTGLASGTYTAEVSAKSNGSAVDNEAVSTMNYSLIVPVSSVTLTTSPANSQKVGKNVTCTAAASGGVTPYQYQFIVKNSSGTTVASQAYGTANTFVWTTTGQSRGTYTIEVDARSNGSTSANDAIATKNYTLN